MRKSSKALSKPLEEIETSDKDDFNEEAYLEINQDVLLAIKSGLFDSGFQHYLQFGKREGRLFKKDNNVSIFNQPTPPITLNNLSEPSAIAEGSVLNGPLPAWTQPDPIYPEAPAYTRTIESVFVSTSGHIFLVGWVDDTISKLNQITVKRSGGRHVDINPSYIARIRRKDVEAALNSKRAHSFGFWAFTAAAVDAISSECEIIVRLDNAAAQASKHQISRMDDVELLNLMLSYLHGADYFGNHQNDGIASLESGLGNEIVLFNKRITSAFCTSPYVESLTKTKRKLRGSIIICLYGKAEYMFVQSALFSGLSGIQDYEFIYVSNSPELAEQLLREINITNLVYGLVQTLILLPGNAGFGAANNVAAKYAHSNRILIVNPDVFPHDQDWAKKHTDLVSALPSDQTNIFGVPLYYDDSSLMHGGMYFELDTSVIFDGKKFTKHRLARVEHYGKGSPPQSDIFRISRPVPAVTGAFMSIDRNWFERLGGFTEDFVFGHYEDADLCLKSLRNGYPAWIHDIKLWHLEGKGSTRLPMHEGGSLVNRWLFSSTWSDLIVASQLNGPDPQNPIFKNSNGSINPRSQSTASGNVESKLKSINKKISKRTASGLSK